MLIDAVISPVAAQDDGLVWEGDAPFLALVDEVDIVIVDEVNDGCWPRPNATKDAVELARARAIAGPGQGAGQ